MSKRKQDTTTVYLLRDIPRDVWRRARSRAVLEGRSMREVIVELLDRWAYEGGFTGASIQGTRKRRKE
jgi:hypothetical protein